MSDDRSVHHRDESPVERRLRAALAARASRVTAAHLRPASPPTLARRPWPRRWSWPAALAGATAFAALLTVVMVLRLPDPAPSDQPGAPASPTVAPEPSVSSIPDPSGPPTPEPSDLPTPDPSGPLTLDPSVWPEPDLSLSPSVKSTRSPFRITSRATPAPGRRSTPAPTRSRGTVSSPRRPAETSSPVAPRRTTGM